MKVSKQRILAHAQNEVLVAVGRVLNSDPVLLAENLNDLALAYDTLRELQLAFRQAGSSANVVELPTRH